MERIGGREREREREAISQKKQKIDSSVSVDPTTTGQSEPPPTLPPLFKHDDLIVPDKEFQEHFSMHGIFSFSNFLPIS